MENKREWWEEMPADWYKHPSREGKEEVVVLHPFEKTPMGMTREEDVDFIAVLLHDASFFHQLYAKYKNPAWLAIAKTNGEIAESLKKRIETK